MKRLQILVVATLCYSTLSAQTSLEEPNLREKTLIAPAYFGPNAFPVPEMSDGTTSGSLRVELAGDYYAGYAGDKTADLFARVQIPLFTDRVNLSVWMPVMEWYRYSLERQRECRLQDTTVMSGSEAGDVYITTDIQVLRERKYAPSIVVRAALRTASGGGYPKARYYDGPGYWFDATFGKTVNLKNDWSLHFAAAGGFLCWQTDNGRQNDAIMYGVQARVRWTYLSATAEWAGYTGWEIAGDRPMILRGTIRGHIKGFEPYISYQWGIRDYPFHQIRCGVVYNINLPLTRRERHQAQPSSEP